VNAVIWLGTCTVLLFGPSGPLLARAGWTRRAPRAAVALWQSLGVAGAFAAIGLGLAIAVEPFHRGLVGGVAALADQAERGHPLQGLGMSGALGLTLAADVCAVLALGLLATGLRTGVTRTRHRRILDLVVRPSADGSGVHVLDDDRAAAYCLPGVRPRIVVTSGTVALLDGPCLAAVVAHERGHARGRHGIVTLPFASMDRLLRWLPYARHARHEVAVLLEMAADDFATRSSPPRLLATALVAMAGSGAPPTCTFAAGSTGVSRRVARLLDERRTSTPVAGLAIGAAMLVPGLPLAILLCG
jgi:Zn-dependent protease with chaperone function